MYSKPTDLRFYWPLYCGGVKHFIWSELGLVVVKIVLCCSAYSVCVLYVLIAQCCVLCYVFCVAGVGAAPGAPRRDHRDCAACDSVTTPQQGGIYSSICQCSKIHISKQEQAIANARLTLNDINTQEWIFRLPGTACLFLFFTPPSYWGKGLLVAGGSLQWPIPQGLSGHAQKHSANQRRA